MKTSIELERIQKNFVILKQLTRNFPYSEFLFPTIPIFAILIQQKLIVSPWSILLISPFLLVHAAGYCYNHICDSDIDSKEINPITRGEITKKQTGYIIGVILIATLITFIALYSSKEGLVLFLVYIFLWFAYSGINIRFKERYLGVFVASFILWVSTPLIIIAEFKYFDTGVIFLIIGIFLVYASREILHTIMDYEEDIRENCNSFAVKVGKKTAIITRYLFLGGGYTFLMASSLHVIGAIFLPIVMLFALIFGTSHLLEFAGSKLNLRVGPLGTARLPYYLISLYFLIYSCFILKLSALTILLVVWAYITTKRY